MTVRDHIEADAALSAPDSGRADQAADEAFALTVLRAIAAMAQRSKRRQADLTAALRGAGVQMDATRLRTALRLLLARGWVERLVPLSDGGVLLSVTTAGLERLGGFASCSPFGAER